MVVQRFRGDSGLYVHLHALTTDGAFEEGGGGVRFLPASPPTPERMTAVLARVNKVLVAADAGDLDMDPALRTCVQFALAGPHLVPPPGARDPAAAHGVGAGHAPARRDVRDRKRLERAILMRQLKEVGRPAAYFVAVLQLERLRDAHMTSDNVAIGDMPLPSFGDDAEVARIVVSNGAHWGL